MGHPLAFDFANRLAAAAPGGSDAGLNRIFFTGSGSEAVDSALKIALAYQRAIGQGTRTRLIGRERSYHGSGFGGTSVGGILGNRRAFQHLPGIDHLRHTHDLARNAFTQGLPEHGADRAEDLEAIVSLHGAETIAAVIVEPVAGSTGVLLPPRGYLEHLRTICNRHGLLLIFDEVITGFGRLGTPFAVDYFGVVPDLVATAKGLTNGTIPMGAVFAQTAIYDALMQGPEVGIELAHGYTYSGHPVACAAGLATLDIYEDEQLLTRGAELSLYWQQAIYSLRDLHPVIDIRTIGLIAGIELQPRDGTVGGRGYDLFVDCFERGLMVRAVGDVIALSPPLIISHAQIEQIRDILADALRRLA